MKSYNFDQINVIIYSEFVNMICTMSLCQSCIAPLARLALERRALARRALVRQALMITARKTYYFSKIAHNFNFTCAPVPL
jgi:hypothetical protein